MSPQGAARLRLDFLKEDLVAKSLGLNLPDRLEYIEIIREAAFTLDITKAMKTSMKASPDNYKSLGMTR